MSKLTTTWWIVFYKDQLLLKKQNNKLTIPCNEQPPLPIPADTHVHEICILEGQPCKAFVVSHPIEESDEYCMTGLRASYDFIPLKQYHTAGKAFEILHWDQHSRFCPVCGTKTEMKDTIMKKCPACGNEMYPSISAAILVLVRKEDSLLLVHARNFKGTFYSLVAGFLETGETLEECVMREVKEETGLDIEIGTLIWHVEEVSQRGQRFVNFFLGKVSGGELALGEDPEFDEAHQVLREVRFMTREEMKFIPKLYPEFLRDEFWSVFENEKFGYNVFRMR